MSIELGDVFPDDYPDFTEFGNPPCSESSPDAFFPEDIEADFKGQRRAAYRFEIQAKSICGTCPYQERCLIYALKNPRETGIWGGTTEYTRRQMRKKLKIIGEL